MISNKSNIQKNNDQLILEKRKRVKMIKRIIVAFVLMAIVVPTFLASFLFFKLINVEQEFNALKHEMAGTHKEEILSSDISGDFMNMSTLNTLVMNKNRFNSLDNDAVEDNEDTEGMTDSVSREIKVCLTFDDGPSANTDKILDILDDYGVKATFFVNAHDGYDQQYKRIVEDGHVLGMHSYSHSYRNLYKSLDSFAEDLFDLQNFLYEKTGVTSNVYRFPGGSSNEVCHVDMQECIKYLKAKNIEYYDWNVSAQDAVAGGTSATEIVNNIMNVINAGETDTYIILMHDAANKNTTVEALPIIIERLADMENVVIAPIDASITPVQHVTLSE